MVALRNRPDGIGCGKNAEKSIPFWPRNSRGAQNTVMPGVALFDLESVARQFVSKLPVGTNARTVKWLPVTWSSPNARLAAREELSRNAPPRAHTGSWRSLPDLPLLTDVQ